MSKRVLVTGASGQLGQSFFTISQNYKDIAFTFVTRKEVDLSEPDSIADYFLDKEFDIVINCAAHTAVDKAESESELANKLNFLAVKQIAEICKAKDMALIHISTDYVFNGNSYRPYVETDSTDPKNVYGETKLKGEQALQDINPNGMIIRTSWVYSEFGNNFVKTMRRLGKERDELSVIFDQVGSPTYAGDLAIAILHIVEHSDFEHQKANSNIYHFSNEGVASWYDFAKAIFELDNIKCKTRPIETKDYPTPAKRPSYSLLSKAKIKNTFNVAIPYWRDSLKICLKKLEE
jgi:dTDP-4-dehydrorhamnose reductase